MFPVTVAIPALPKLPTLALAVTLNVPVDVKLAVVKLPPVMLPVATTCPVVFKLLPDKLPTVF